jgi:hypothetical protein
LCSHVDDHRPVFGGATTILGSVLFDARDLITRIGGIVGSSLVCRR